MSGKSVNFGDKKIKTYYFQKNKKIIKIDNIDVNKILVSKEKTYGSKNTFKYFIGYNDGDAIKPLCIKFSQMIGYFRHFDGNRPMSFKINDSKLLKKCKQT